MPQTKVFITHSWRDIEFARRLYDDLKAHGLEVWFDDKSLRAGHRMAEEINRGLAWCDVYIPVISRESLASNWCDEEINAAISLSVEGGNAKPRIISALVGDCRDELKKRYPSLVARLYINFTGHYDDALRELLTKGFRLTPEPASPQVPPIEQLYQQGWNALLLNRLEDGVMAFRRVVAIDPNYRDALLRLREAENLLARSIVPEPAMPARPARQLVSLSFALATVLICTVLSIFGGLAVSGQLNLIALAPTATSPATAMLVPQSATPTAIATRVSPTAIPTISATLVPLTATRTPTRSVVTATPTALPMKFGAPSLTRPIWTDNQKDEVRFPSSAIILDWQSVGGLGGDECYLVQVSTEPVNPSPGIGSVSDYWVALCGEQIATGASVKFTLESPNRIGPAPNYGSILLNTDQMWAIWSITVAKNLGQCDPSDQYHCKWVPISPPGKGRFLFKGG